MPIENESLMMFDKIKYFVLIPALLHFYFMYLEMVLWEKKRIVKLFGMTAEFASQSRKLAMNQGLYNGFLASGLILSLFINDSSMSLMALVFFLVCIIIAGVFGAITVTKKILFIQAIPAAAILLALLILK